MFQKIHIFGGPGSGKTYAAKKISTTLKISHLDLDELYWDRKAKKYDIKTPITQRDKKLSKILNKPAWVIEGVYYSWVEPSFAQSNIVIVLRVNKYLRDYRIVRRFILRKLGLVKSKKEDLFDLYNLLKWNHKFDTDWMIKTEHLLLKFKRKVIYFTSAQRAVEYILDQQLLQK